MTWIDLKPTRQKKGGLYANHLVWIPVPLYKFMRMLADYRKGYSTSKYISELIRRDAERVAESRGLTTDEIIAQYAEMFDAQRNAKV